MNQQKRRKTKKNEEEKKYYLKTKSLNNGLGSKFLAYYSFNNQWFFTNKDNLNIHKAKFTKKEINEIKEKYNTDLKDFKIEEVKD